jgi:hypothetical protein
MPINQPVPGVPGAEIHEVDFIPDSLEGAVRVGPYSSAKPGALLRVVPGVGRFLALDGQLIKVSRDKDSDPIEVDQFLYGAVRAALIHQRGGFPLHAACLVQPETERAFAIAGPSGAGKSTLARELVRRGWSLLGDDLTAVYYERREILAWPSRPGIKLWRDACDYLGSDLELLDRIPGERDKYIVPVVVRKKPVRLAGMFLLDRTRSGGIVCISGPERLSALHANTYRPKYMQALGCVSSHFNLTCHISNQIELNHLQHSGTVTTCADLVEKGCQKRTHINC